MNEAEAIGLLMRSFPSCHFSFGEVRDVWALCHLHGALQPGMTAWLNEHALAPCRRIGLDGYEIRWITQYHWQKAKGLL